MRTTVLCVAFTLALVVLLAADKAFAFVVHTPTSRVVLSSSSSPAFSQQKQSLHAKKRRKRKDAATGPSTMDDDDDQIESQAGMDGNNVVSNAATPSVPSDLPDFDLDEEAEEEALASRTADAASGISTAAASSPVPSSINFNTVTDRMMGSSVSPKGSVEDLLSDRSLEKLVEEKVPDPSVPDLADYLKNRQGASDGFAPLPPSGMGKKKARQAARQEAAIAKQKAEDDAKARDILGRLTFLQNEKGEFSFVKVRFMMLHGSI